MDSPDLAPEDRLIAELLGKLPDHEKLKALIAARQMPTAAPTVERQLAQRFGKKPGQVLVTDLLEALPQFQPKEDWKAWRAFLCAAFGLPMDMLERGLYADCTGRSEPPQQQAKEAWMIVGRRGGKGRAASLIATYLAVFRDYTPYLAQGQVGVLPVIAAGRDQAQEVMNYLKGIFETPWLAPMVEAVKAEEIQLSNRVVIAVRAASFRMVRAHTYLGGVLDEIAFWRNEDSRNPDAEIVRALRPGMATIPHAMLIGLSSPYAKRGVLWETFEHHYGKPGDILVWKAPTLRMHDTLQLREVIEVETEKDPIAAAAEYGAEFRSDVEMFVQPEIVDGVTAKERTAVAPQERVVYCAFVDPSGGSSDSMTMGIGHWEAPVPEKEGQEAKPGRAVLDALMEKPPPFEPDAVVADFASLLQRYGIKYVSGDRYGGDWPASRFRAHGIYYQISELTKSDIYREFLPLMNSKTCELLDHKRLKAQLTSLERHARSGKDTIDHPPGGHDDVANSCAGVLTLVDQQRRAQRPKKEGPKSPVEKLLKSLHGHIRDTVRGGEGRNRREDRGPWI